MLESTNKCSREYDVSEMEEGKCMSDHGIPVDGPPAKESRRTKGVHYFEAKLTDGKRCAHGLLRHWPIVCAEEGGSGGGASGSSS